MDPPWNVEISVNRIDRFWLSCYYFLIYSVAAHPAVQSIRVLSSLNKFLLLLKLKKKEKEILFVERDVNPANHLLIFSNSQTGFFSFVLFSVIRRILRRHPLGRDPSGIYRVFFSTELRS